VLTDDVTFDTFDKDGRLHLGQVPITVAAVETYTGRELLDTADRIPGGIVDPRRSYLLLRSASELERSASSFRNVPITRRHVFGLDELKPAVIGTVGSNVRFADPYLLADAVVWTQDAIDNLQNGSMACPSIGYRYSVELRPGAFNGEHYHGTIEGLHGHHLALCAEGRSGLSIVPRTSLPYRSAA
jgi:hypothetical protein